MLAIYETVNRRLTRADEIEEGTWICLTAPSQEEIREVAAKRKAESARGGAEERDRVGIVSLRGLRDQVLGELGGETGERGTLPAGEVEGMREGRCEVLVQHFDEIHPVEPPPHAVPLRVAGLGQPGASEPTPAFDPGDAAQGPAEKARGRHGRARQVQNPTRVRARLLHGCWRFEAQRWRANAQMAPVMATSAAQLTRQYRENRAFAQVDVLQQTPADVC